MRKVKIAMSLIVSTLAAYGQELENPKQIAETEIESKINSEEEFIETGKTETLEEGLYTVIVNRNIKNDGFSILESKDKLYLSLLEFFEMIDFNHYTKNGNNLIMYLGDSGEKVVIDLKNETIERKIGKENLPKKSVIVDGDIIYLDIEIFRKLFFKSYSINRDTLTVNASLDFETPEEISNSMKYKKDDINEKNSKETTIFTGEGKLFEVGNARVILEQTFEKTGGEDFKKDWEGKAEYRGELLYGTVTTNYDFRRGEWGDVELYYQNIYKNHSLTLGGYGVNTGEKEWGLRIRKEKGYFIDDGNVVIRERVPLGSTVELLYRNVPIEIKDEVNGEVEFINPLIKLDREYVLKIYNADNTVEYMTIKTARDYNQQKKGELEYDIALREDKESDSYDGDLNIYYGLNENLTISGNYSRTPTSRSYFSFDDDNFIPGRDRDKDNKKYKFEDLIGGEVIYSNKVYNSNYTLKLLGDKEVSDTHEMSDENFTYGYFGTIDIKDLRITAEEVNYGKSFDEKKEQKVEFEYEILDGLDLKYDFSRLENHDGTKENDYGYGGDYTYSKGSFLGLIGYRSGKDKHERYNLDLHYNGFDKVGLSLRNEFEKDEDKDGYRSVFAVNNKKLSSNVDWTFEASYSDVDKLVYGVRFNMKIADLFTLDVDTARETQRYGVGIDRVIDLKNPTKTIDSINASRVKIVTFLDENNNGVFDSNEKRVERTKVGIGKQEIETDENGVGFMHGLPNGIEYPVKVTTLQPEYTLGNREYKVIGRRVSEIEMHIPIKPLVNLSGLLIFDDKLNLTEDDKQEIYANTLVKIKDQNGKVIEMAIPEGNGIFDISGLFPEKYLIEIEYFGTRKNLKSISEEILLAYNSDSEKQFAFDMSKGISINK